MSALYLSVCQGGNDGVVRAPRATDTIGAALRGVFGEPARLADDMARLLALLDQPMR